jgi:hypothetical protein
VTARFLFQPSMKLFGSEQANAARMPSNLAERHRT